MTICSRFSKRINLAIHHPAIILPSRRTFFRLTCYCFGFFVQLILSLPPLLIISPNRFVRGVYCAAALPSACCD